MTYKRFPKMGLVCDCDSHLILAVVTGRYRRLMAQYFKRPPQARRYGQRWQVEEVFSMIKRRPGETVSARSYHRQNRALLPKAIAHNVLILLWLMRFSTEQDSAY